MDQSDTATSPTPFSPFSPTQSFGSEGGTSDEPVTLGHFATVFRELNEIVRNPIWPGPMLLPTPTSSMVVSASDSEQEVVHTVWSHGPIADYLSSSSDRLESETEAEVADTVDQPSLGYLDGVLGFIAAERERFAAQRETGPQASSQASTSEHAWRHVIEPRRRRRRKRGRHGTTSNATMDSTLENESICADGDGDGDADADADGASSEPEFGPRDVKGKSVPATPLRVRKQRAQHLPRLAHSRSTPSLRLAIPSPPDPRVLRLRALATKLRLLFPEDTRCLSTVLLNDTPDPTDFIDPRGRPTEAADPPTHIFIDHSNILIGFINYLKRNPPHPRRTRTHLSHAALALILERGRPVARRVLATSSPLYQPMEGAEHLGYEVRVYARVPDTGDGADRLRAERDSRAKRGQGHGRTLSTGATSTTESDPGSAAPSRPPGHSRSNSGTAGMTNGAGGSNGAGPSSSSVRVKYREQGVDELLQLKLHQSIASVDVAPPGSTIVLATGDGNVGQFNEEGFLGCVRTALKKGWHVELYAWELGLSKAWSREFGGMKGFSVIGLEKFGQDLLELP
ncbi:hypothetical protein BD410DRAFT_774362 [Rickenella mellea]|uniref:NYN domain-containing protein n=1 Tax=Rickenella mellea TaxID=50990 RepID=A0A4Y7PU93_9AGAM|nr:hypothetical protein BD410DRAFT_774362 [Rickenella mellea]